ncbi:hypothetical protein HY636_00850 [Candidatus Woesearchaeota archaeon]|nr:hypothetical protein [Candidatus Woesearchaeota archaeon]
MTLDYCLTKVAPLYNLALVVIVIIMFLKLFMTPNKERYTKPWALIFAGILIFVLEEVFTILRHSQIFILPTYVNGIFEITIISLFIYAMLLQREYNAFNYGALKKIKKLKRRR